MRSRLVVLNGAAAEHCGLPSSSEQDQGPLKGGFGDRATRRGCKADSSRRGRTPLRPQPGLSELRLVRRARQRRRMAMQVGA